MQSLPEKETRSVAPTVLVSFLFFILLSFLVSGSDMVLYCDDQRVQPVDVVDGYT